MGAKVRYRDGRGWFVRTYANGKQVEEKCDSEAEARAVADAINRRSKARLSWLTGGAMPIDKTLEGWLEARGPTLAKSTKANASSLVKNHLTPFFGRLDLRHLSRDDLIEFADTKLKAGLSPSLVEGALSVLRRVCQLHVEEGLLDRNPCIGSGKLVARVARNYEHLPREIDAWTYDEVDRLLALAVKHEPYVHGPLLCALHTGMRRGEVLGLHWKDVGESRLHVRRALVRNQITTPKSGRSREVPISAALSAVLEDLRAARQREEGPWTDPEFVFLSPYGRRWDERTFARDYKRLIRLAHKKANVRPLTFHCARHTFASWALEGGRSIKWVQERLGHASAELTLKTYSHLLPAERDELDFLSANRRRKLSAAELR